MLADLDMLYNELNRLNGFKAYKSYANFILVKIPVEIKASMKKYLDDQRRPAGAIKEEWLRNWQNP